MVSDILANNILSSRQQYGAASLVMCRRDSMHEVPGDKLLHETEQQARQREECFAGFDPALRSQNYPATPSEQDFVRFILDMASDCVILSRQWVGLRTFL
jgi:hypothetical protein